MSQEPNKEKDNTTALINYNLPQFLWYLTRPKISVNLWGRGTGKTTGPQSAFTLQNALDMPRSNGVLVGPTYEKLLTQMLPNLVRGWEKFGYIEDKHFFVRKLPPKKYGLPRAYITPLKADHYVSWWNGSGHSLVSLDKPSTLGNGMDSDYLSNDESKLCSRDKLKEVIPTVRGNGQFFGHLSCHGSMMFSSDMPTNSKGKWLLDYEHQMDKDKIEIIIQTQVHIIKLSNDLLTKNYSPSYTEKVKKEIVKFSNYLTQLRKDAVYVSFASTLDNVHELGLDPIKILKRTLTDLEFQTSVLNKRILQAENGFYPRLDEDKHGYDMTNHAFIDSLDHRNIPQKDCRWDADLQQYAPIDVAMDYNNAINCMVVGQRNDNGYRFLNSLFVLKKDNQFTRDAVKKFCLYYRHTHCKRVNYTYDNTAIGGKATGDLSNADTVIDEFKKQGWAVNPIYIGQATTHYSRYQAWVDWLGGKDSRLPKFTYNRTNCRQWQISCQLTGILNGRDGFKKDKRTENDTKIPPEEAPHLSEAGDTLMTWVLGDYNTPHTDFTDLTAR